MAFRIDVEYRKLLPKIKKRQLQRLLKAAMGIVAAFWHDTYSQGKFTTGAARRYQYGRRQTKNVRTGAIKLDKRRRPRAPSGLPLVWSSRTRSLAKRRRIRANSKRSSVASPVRALTFVPPGNRSLRMWKEYKKVLPVEERRLAKRAERFLRRQFKHGRRNIQVIINS